MDEREENNQKQEVQNHENQEPINHEQEKDGNKILKKKTKINFKIIYGLFALFAILVFAYFFFAQNDEPKDKWYRISKPEKKDLVQYVNSSGRLKAQEEITVGSLVAGRVINLLVDDNDFVKKDQVLVELDDGIRESAVKKWQATLLNAKSQFAYQEKFFARQKSIYEAKQLAEDTFEQYKRDYNYYSAAVLEAEADLEIRQKEYDNLFIKSPVDGIVIARKVDLGQMITARFQATELFSIAKDLKKMEVEIDVDESDIGLVQDGQDAIFYVDAFPKKQFGGKVKQVKYHFTIIDNVVTYATILDVDNPDLKLRPGMTTNVDIEVARAKNALCIPNRALRINEGIIESVAKKIGFGFEPFVKNIKNKNQDLLWIVDGEKFKQVKIKIGASDRSFSEVLKGLNEGDSIVTEAFDPSRTNPIMAMGKLRA